MNNYTTLEDQFFNWLENIRGREARTIKEYKYYFKKLKQVSSEFNQKTIDDFLSNKITKNNVSRSMLRSLKEYLLRNQVETGLTADDIKIINAVNIDSLGMKERPEPDVLSRDKIMKMHDSMKSEGSRIMLLLSYYCGLRAKELTQIKYGNFNWVIWKENKEGNGKLFIKGKGGKESWIPVKNFLMDRIDKWVNAEFSPLPLPEEKLFPITYHKWWHIMDDISIEALGEHIHPHTLRHSIATHLIELGWDIKEIQRFLRHKDISSTQIYTHISEDHLNKKYEQI